MSLRGASALVTGATGFLGSHLVRALVRAGADVHLIVRTSSHPDRLADLSDVPRTTIDDWSSEALTSCLRAVRPDVVFHLAGHTGTRRSMETSSGAGSFADAFEANTTQTLRLMLAVADAHPTARIVRTGGLAEYGIAPVPFHEDQREAPVSPYGVTQLAATHLGQTLYRDRGLAVTTIRPALTYGPDQSPGFLIPAVIDACMNHRPFTLRSPHHTRDFVYVDDVIDALMRAGTAPHVAGEIMNAGSGREIRIGDVADLIVRLSHADIELRSDTVSTDPADLARLVYDSRKAAKALGWTATTTLEAGLSKTIASY